MPPARGSSSAAPSASHRRRPRGTGRGHLSHLHPLEQIAAALEPHRARPAGARRMAPQLEARRLIPSHRAEAIARGDLRDQRRASSVIGADDLARDSTPALAAVLDGGAAGADGERMTPSRDLTSYAGLGTSIDFTPARASREPEREVAAMARNGARTLYLQTGNYKQNVDVIRPRGAGRFIDAAHAAGLRLIASYLPSFAAPRQDSGERWRRSTSAALAVSASMRLRSTSRRRWSEGSRAPRPAPARAFGAPAFSRWPGLSARRDHSVADGDVALLLAPPPLPGTRPLL